MVAVTCNLIKRSSKLEIKCETSMYFSLNVGYFIQLILSVKLDKNYLLIVVKQIIAQTNRLSNSSSALLQDNYSI